MQVRIQAERSSRRNCHMRSGTRRLQHQNLQNNGSALAVHCGMLRILHFPRPTSVDYRHKTAQDLLSIDHMSPSTRPSVYPSGPTIRQQEFDQLVSSTNRIGNSVP